MLRCNINMNTSSAQHDGLHDFDFFMGKWKVQHRRLKERLVGCDEWVEFDGTCMTQKLLNGQANVDDNVLNIPQGMYRAISLRSLRSRETTLGHLVAR